MIEEITFKKEYYKRLTSPYSDKQGKKKLFIDQYLQGSGNELESKFWSPNSSSRLAFDLYSWIVKEDCIVDFQFEKKLPGVICSKKGPAGVPNMDVYFETDCNRVFIESKYTESSSLAYTRGKSPNLSKAYWAKDVYGGLNITERFYGEENIALSFSNFCSDIQNIIDSFKGNQWKWFDVKQETCHLFGIIFFLLGGQKENKQYICTHPKKLLNKKVHLCNIIWELENDNFDIKEDSLPSYFEKKAKKLVEECVPSIEFEYRILTVEELLGEKNFFGLDYTKAKPYGIDDISLKELMNQYNQPVKKRGNK